MLAVGAYARRGVRHPLAIDLGTSMVRIWAPGLETVVNEPAVVAFGPVPDQRAAGRAAFEVARRTGAPLIWPVRDGVVDNLAACVYLLRTLVAATGRPADDPSPVVVGVPATATLRQLHLIMTAVHHATGGRVSAVEEPLAAALACFPASTTATTSSPSISARVARRSFRSPTGRSPPRSGSTPAGAT